MASHRNSANATEPHLPAVSSGSASLAAQQRILLGKYEILSETRHPNCTLYEATSTTGKRVAIKEICAEHVKGCDIDALANFFKTISREAETLQRIDHPNVVKYVEHQHDEANDRFYLVTEWIDGQNVAQVMETSGFEKIKAKEAICSVLDTVGALGSLVPPIVHRDIKPQNIMICPDGRIVLVDFGFSRSPRGTGTTFLALPISSLGYTAPEIAQGKPGSPRSDLYSIAAVYLYLLTGKNPDDLAKADGTGFDFPDEVDQPTRRFIEKAMAMDPNNRFASAEEMKTAFLGLGTIVKADESSLITGYVGQSKDTLLTMTSSGPRELRCTYGLALIQKCMREDDWKTLALLTRTGIFNSISSVYIDFINAVGLYEGVKIIRVLIPRAIRTAAREALIPTARNAFDKALASNDPNQALEVIWTPWRAHPDYFCILPEKYRVDWGLELVRVCSENVLEIVRSNTQSEIHKAIDWNGSRYPSAHMETLERMYGSDVNLVPRVVRDAAKRECFGIRKLIQTRPLD